MIFSPPSTVPPKNIRNPGLGQFHVLSDDILVQMVVQYVPLLDLLELSATSKLFRLLLVSDTIFKLILLRKTTTEIEFRGSWKETLQGYLVKSGKFEKFDWYNNDLKYYSPFIELRQQLCEIDLHEYWPVIDNLKQLQCFPQGEMSFNRLLQYEMHSEPFMIRAGIDASWISNSSWHHTTLSTFCKQKQTWVGNSHGPKKYLRMTMSNYLDYFWKQKDDSPLYLFDKDFGTEMKFLLKAYKKPDFVKEDYLGLLGDARPAYRWIVVGPMRTGASWHIDPPGTTAWNTLICGRKLWALYPPNREPPKSELSTLLWYLTVYPNLGVMERPLEIVQFPGDTIVVPEGWWHCILNLESVNTAVTQNFASRVNLKGYLDHISHKPQVSLTFNKKLEAALKSFEIEPILADLVTRFRNKKIKPTLAELLPTAQEILNLSEPNHQYSVNENDFTLSETDNQVLYHQGSKLFIKLIILEREAKFKTEIEALKLVKNSLVGIIPQLIASGRYEQYYFITTK